MARKTRVKLDLPIERFTLDNGLRVVMSPDRSAPVVAVAVYYDVGFRSEPEGRTGFAHLFEHMMFQGSEHVDKMEHASLINSAGGTLNGSTTPDYTNYFEILPSPSLEVALFLEADRMRSLRLTTENLENQIAVVKEEIRVNVLNRPYGGFPWIHLSELMFDTFANSHNGYGSFVDLESATLDDVEDFFSSYYAPANAALTVLGDFEGTEARRLIELHFGQIPERPAPKLPSFSEPPFDRTRRAVHPDPLAPTPALALGYRAPDPIENVRDVLALTVLTEVLTEGEAARLQRRLVRQEGLVTTIDGWLGVFSGFPGPFERDPTRLQLVAHYPEPDRRDDIMAAIDEEVAAVMSELSEEDVERVTAQVTGTYLRAVDDFLYRALTIAPLELHRGKAELVNEYPDLLAEVTPQAVADAAARWMRPAERAVLEVLPGAGS